MDKLELKRVYPKDLVEYRSYLFIYDNCWWEDEWGESAFSVGYALIGAERCQAIFELPSILSGILDKIDGK